MASDIAIRAVDLTKDFQIYGKPSDLALELLLGRARHQVFRALDSVTFEIPEGGVVGIIGENGAGKSTLLKILAGVLEPTGGRVEINGKVTAILELGLGFNPEYSGRENIYLSGLLYGMAREEIDRKIDDIIGFAELGEFIERPVKSYSSGMQSRLAFSIATAVDPDILIIDEALAAGDAAFVQKCMRRIRQLCSGGRTVLMVSHGTGLLAQLCETAMWLDHGRVRMFDGALRVIQAYDLEAHRKADSNSWIEEVDDTLAEEASKDAAEGAVSQADFGTERHGSGRKVFRRGPVLIDRVELLDAEGRRTSRLIQLQPFTIRVHYHCEGPPPAETLGVAVAINNRADLSPVAQFMTQNIRPGEDRSRYGESPERRPAQPQGVIDIACDGAIFRKGDYLLSLGILANQPGNWEFYEYRHFFYEFSVDDLGFDLAAPVWLPARVLPEGSTGGR